MGLAGCPALSLFLRLPSLSQSTRLSSPCLSKQSRLWQPPWSSLLPAMVLSTCWWRGKMCHRILLPLSWQR